MKFCMKHWDALKEAIRARGLDGLSAKTGETVVAKQVEELKAGESSKTTFDPLMGAHNAIVVRALDIVGLDLLTGGEGETEKCPICYLQAGHDATCKEEGCTHSFEPWIGFAADAMRKEAIRLNLMAES